MSWDTWLVCVLAALAGIAALVVDGDWQQTVWCAVAAFYAVKADTKEDW